jgi:hypothetical protein
MGITRKVVDIPGNAETVTTVTAIQVLTALKYAVVGNIGTYAMLRYDGVDPIIATGTVKSNSELSYTNAEGNVSGRPPINSQWQCMGFSTDANARSRTSLWLRIS